MAALLGDGWHTYARRTHHSAIIDLIRFTPGGISRVEIARQLGLTRSAVTAIIQEMISGGLVRETEDHVAPTGRRPITLEINPHKGWVIGIDLGARHALLALADFSARVEKELEAALDITAGPSAVMEQLDLLLMQLLQGTPYQVSDIAAVGLGVPGPVSLRSGVVIEPPIMPGWGGYPIVETLQHIWGRPVSLNNDAELGALGEWAYGAGRGEQNLVYIKMGTGVGAGLLLDGSIYHGANGCAGEIGHLTMNDEGPICTCGNRGCLESLVGSAAIAEMATQAVRKGQRTQLTQIAGQRDLDALDVIAAAQSGDLLAQRIMIEAGERLGTAIASLVTLFNPGIVVVGGSVSQIGDLLLEPVRRIVSQRSLPAASREVRITTALLGKRASCMGAIVQALTLALHWLADRKEVRFRTKEPGFGRTPSALKPTG